ncbi:MAG: hypothetical protein ACE1ZE_06455 [Candidatus Binatia bacterium]
MPQGLIIRLGVLFISICTSLVYLMPSFVEQLPPWWTRLFPSEGLHLGLDLQGGTHLVLEVKVEKALQNNMERLRDDLVNLFKERTIPITNITLAPDYKILIRIPSQSSQKVRDLIRSEAPNLVFVKAQSGAEGAEILLGLQERELRTIRDDAVEQSLETIRNRIDQFGVSEPTIQRQGQRDIIIQLPGIQDPERAKDLIGMTALLEFKLVDERNDPQEAVTKGPPPGREILYSSTSRVVGGLGVERVPYLLEAKTLMT